ncbi:MAG: hypothetical protein WC560_07535 [Syntrophales bacterium]
MKVAIPLFGNWISPRFGFSSEMWLLNIEQGKIISQSRISMTGLAIPQWLNHISSLGVDSIICGGIDRFCHHQLENLGISVIPEIVGEANEVLSLFLNGELQPGLRICPGKGRNFRGRRGREGMPLGLPGAMDEKKK